jgi:hypothetical protein
MPPWPPECPRALPSSLLGLLEAQESAFQRKGEGAEAPLGKAKRLKGET